MNRGLAARAVGEAGTWVAVLSADDPMHAARPWRLLHAAGNLSSAVAAATGAAPRARRRAPAPRPGVHPAH